MIFKLELNPNDSYIALGQLIKYYRLQRGFSLRDLGQLANISHTLIANIEQGRASANGDTLREIFKILEIEFYNDEEFRNNFIETYDRAFDYLFKYEYTRAIQELESLFIDEYKYVHSTLITDYGLLKFLYLVLLEKPADDGFVNLDTFKKVSKYYSDKQRQLLHFIEGIDYYNKGLYLEAEKYLNNALKIGVSALDNLINVFLVKCYVRMYRFMDVMRLGNQTIDYFEENVMYLRAMEVRLSIAYSYLLVRKYQDARIVLDRVYQFSILFNAKYLIEECRLLLAALEVMNNNTDEARNYLSQLKKNTPIVYFMAIRAAMRDGNIEEAKRIYKNCLEHADHTQNFREQKIIEIAMKEYGVIQLDEKEFIKQIEEVIAFGKRALDMEVIDSTYSILIRYYKANRMYKKALEASEIARDYRRFGHFKS